MAILSSSIKQNLRRFPVKLGFDLSGTVVEIGSSVDTVAVGDEVFCCLPPAGTGSWSEYALTTASLLAHKPKSLSHVDAASLPTVAMTTLQALEKVPNGFAGKTILIPAGRTCVQFRTIKWPYTFRTNRESLKLVVLVQLPAKSQKASMARRKSSQLYLQKTWLR